MQDGIRQSDAGEDRDAEAADAEDAGNETHDTGATDRPLCDGSATLRLYAARGGGGAPEPGTQVLYENGLYLVVKGDCTFWAYGPDAGGGVYGVARTGTLSASQGQDLARAFRLSELAELAGDYSKSACDAPEEVYWFGGARVRVFPQCADGADSEIVRSLGGAWSERFAELRGMGAAASSGVRFTLVLEDREIPPGYLAYRDAPSWPINGDPSLMAISSTEAGAYQPGSSRAADGPDAQALRALRSALIDGTIGFVSAGFIPIQQADGAKYQLYVRDAIDLENDRGLLPFEW